MNKQSTIIKYTLTKAAFQTALGKYFALILNNGTHDLAAISAKMQDGRPAIEDADVKLTIAALVDAVTEEVVVNHNRVDLGTFSVELAISGSVQSMDGALTEENEIYILLTPSDAFRNEVAKIIPSRASSDKMKVKLENVEDLSTHRKLIRGTGEFVLTGSGLSAKCEGESLVLCTLDGEEVVVATVLAKEGMGERIYAQLVESVESGTYLLRLVTRGYYTPDAEPESYTKKVQVESVEHVEIAKVMATTSDGNRCFWAEGTDFSAVEGYREFEEDEQRRFACTCEVSVNGESRGTFELTGTFPEEGDLLAPEIDDAIEFEHGDEVKAVFRIDPAKTDYDQTPVERTTVAD